jgi:hypothetical protein
MKVILLTDNSTRSSNKTDIITMVHLPMLNRRNIFLLVNTNQREGVGTLNFRTTTGHFFQNVEIVFLVYHYYDITTSKMSFELITTTTIRTLKTALKIDF